MLLDGLNPFVLWGVGSIGSLAFWLSAYYLGRWEPWPENIHVVSDRHGALVRTNMRDGFVREPWRLRREAWGRAGIVGALLTMLIALGYLLAAL